MSSNPKSQTGTNLWPIKNRVAQQEVSGRWASITAWAQLPVRSVEALDSHRSTNSIVNCACEWSRFHAFYENLMPQKPFPLCRKMVIHKIGPWYQKGTSAIELSTHLSRMCILFSSVHETFSRLDHMLGHRTSLSKFKRTKLVQRMISNHNRMKLEVNNKRRFHELTNT